MPEKLVIRTFCLGVWQTNCYLVGQEGDPAVWVVDCGFNPEPMIRAIQQENLVPQQVVLTHAHVDHIAGLNTLRGHYPDLPILIHRNEKDFLADPLLNLSALAIEPVIVPEADRLLSGGETLTLGAFSFEVLNTPGHSPGGISLYSARGQTVFTGDALFHDSVGRSDFPTSDPQLLWRSIQDVLLPLPDATGVYPGHMIRTTIGRERRLNPFVRDGQWASNAR